MATKNTKKKNGLKKHDWFRIVGEPMMVAGHCATMVGIGGEMAKTSTIIGAACMIVWVTVEVVQFVKKRNNRVRTVLSPA